MCITPLGVRQKMTNQTINVPCGRCPLCVKRRQSAWSFRLMQEEKVSTSAMFITLTYDTAKVPITQNGYMSVSKKDVQLFFKRLRLKNTERIKYYTVAEYGGKTNRPHYHAIIFNLDSMAEIQNAWNLGSIHYGQVTGASIGYTLKYMSKKGKIPAHRNDDRCPQFALMSKGLGLNYVTEQIIQWHLNDPHERMYCTTADGKKITMPRYFKQKIYSDEQRKAIGAVTRARMEEAQQKERENYEGSYDRDKAEAHLQQFAHAAKNISKGDKL